MNPEIKKLRDEGAAAYKAGTDLMAQYKEKPASAEVNKQIDAHFDESTAKFEQAERLEKAERLNEHLNKPINQLVPPGTDGKGAEDTLHQKAFRKHLKLQELTAEERKALAANDDAAGGFLVTPVQFSQALLKFADDRVSIRQLATVERIEKADSLGVVTMDSDIEDWDWTSEVDTGGESTAKPLGQRQLVPHPLAKLVKISRKLIRVSARPVETIVAQRLAYKRAVTEEKQFLTGDGVQKPLGIFTPSADGLPVSRDVTYTDTNDQTRADSYIDAKFALKEQYMMSPTTRWIMSREAVKRIRKLKDQNGMPAWDPTMGLLRSTAGDISRGPTFLDIPIIMSEFAPAAFTSGSYVAALIDLAFYWIVDALNMELQVLDQLFARTNQIGYIVRSETDGQPVLAEAGVRLKVA